MTIAGAICLVSGDAVAWIDDAIFRDEVFSRSQSKLAVNALIGAVGVGCGWWRVAREGHAALHDATDFDELCAQLPERLQRAQAKCREGSSTFAVVGHSFDLGRLIVCVFDSGDGFEPHLLTLVLAICAGDRAR